MLDRGKYVRSNHFLNLLSHISYPAAILISFGIKNVEIIFRQFIKRRGRNEATTTVMVCVSFGCLDVWD
jgi:hypothetical protein